MDLLALFVQKSFTVHFSLLFVFYYLPSAFLFLKQVVLLIPLDLLFYRFSLLAYVQIFVILAVFDLLLHVQESAFVLGASRMVFHFQIGQVRIFLRFRHLLLNNEERGTYLWN